MTPEKIGRYVITGELGKGAMGVVYRATDPNIGRTVALKTMRVDIHGASSADMLKRFQNEARAAGVLNHRNIITIYDAGEADGMFYIAMEYIPGTTLAGLLRERKTLSPEEAAKIGAQVCEGLDYAHYKGVIHRDIKPANIMIAADGVVKIMDFGIAKAGAGLTHTGEVLGTPNYMSPEQVRGRAIDGRTDLFATGVILYEMLTGEKPFNANSVTTIIYKIINEVPPPPRELDASIPTGLSAVITKAMSKLPDDRYQSGSAMAAALQDPFTLCSELTAGTADQAMVTTHFFAATTLDPSSGIQKAVSGTAGLAPAIVAEPAFTPAVVLDATSRKKTESEPLVEKTIAVAPPKAMASKPAAIVKRVALRPAKRKRGPGLLFAAVLVALFCLLVMANASRKHKALLAAQAAAQQPVATAAAATARTAPKIAPVQPIEAAVPAPAPPATVPTVQTVADVKTAPEGKPLVETGELKITSDPAGAQVEIDGRMLDKWITPFTTPALHAGLHTVKVSLEGYKPAAQKVEVVANKRTPLALSLQQMQATLSVNSNPAGANIVVDGIPTGQVTPAEITVDPGQHKVVVRKQGFRWAETLADAGPGQTLNFSPELQPQGFGVNGNNNGRLAAWRKFEQSGQLPPGKGGLQVRTIPSGAQIAVNDIPVPRSTPFRFPVPPGTYRVRLSMDGYYPITKIVQVDEGNMTTIVESLQAK
ncbi:MAG TPA: serine/threonine-protein kinase [Terriglobales bacterium]|nr:serine/threonine-protein kinase [Terriglobales bacterium]